MPERTAAGAMRAQRNLAFAPAVLWAIVTHVAMLPVLPYMHKAFTEWVPEVGGQGVRNATCPDVVLYGTMQSLKPVASWEGQTAEGRCRTG